VVENKDFEGLKRHVYSLAFTGLIMRKHIGIIFLFLSVASYAQPLRDINYAYLYDPAADFTFDLKPVRGQKEFTVLYKLQLKGASAKIDDYSIFWEGRSMLNEKEGVTLSFTGHVPERGPSSLEGRATIPVAEAPAYIAAKVVKNSASRAWMYFTPLDPAYPVNNFLIRNGHLVIDSYVHTKESVQLAYDSGEWIVSYYDDDFPAAAPAFSEAQARVSRVMQVDSIYKVAGGSNTSFLKKGLYLVQKDTTSLQGFAFRAEEDYPQFSKLTSLADPLIYISTKQEFDRLQLARGNKKAFDRVILSIASDTERARILMRSYFRRVELANRFFTSYKEGWKTDRGMIYIIFGKPEEVFRFADREVWNYKNERFNIRFTFVRSSSLFDPDNFVLIRDKKYEDSWYEVIDLWRNARF
jgi:GWxTD domain-containing protein